MGKKKFPEASGPVPNSALPPIVIPIESYDVGSWCKSLDGSGKPEQVHLTITPAKIRSENDLFAIAKWTLDKQQPPPHVLRFKSADALKDFIGALTRHLIDVWPEEAT